jgi:hypothetical protein
MIYMRKLFLAVLLVFVLLPVAVTAAGDSRDISVDGNIINPQYGLEIFFPPDTFFVMSAGDNSWFAPPGYVPDPPIKPAPLPPAPPAPAGLTVVAHATRGVVFSVSASDKLLNGKPTASKGKMAEHRANWTQSNLDMCNPTGPPPSRPVATQGWVASGKMLTKPLRLNETLVMPPAPGAPGVFKEYNMSSTTDPVLFTGMGDSQPGGGWGPGISRNYDVRQQITLADTNVVSLFPAPPAQCSYHFYRMPITFTLTAL